MPHAPLPAHSALIRRLHRLGFGALVTAVLCLQPAWADKDDRFQALNFAADSVRVDESSRVNVLKGNVEITKGSIVLRSALVEVRQGADATQSAVAIGGVNGRAFFRQRREGLDEFIEGEAERVEYDGRADVVRFVGRAVMRRLSGGVVADEVVGQTVVYDNKTEVFQVVGGAKSAASSGRVRGVISPRKDPQPSDGKSGGVRTPAPADAARLSATPTLSKPDLESTGR